MNNREWNHWRKKWIETIFFACWGLMLTNFNYPYIKIKCLFDLLNGTSLVARVICLFFILREKNSKAKEHPGNNVYTQIKFSQITEERCKYILDLTHPSKRTEIMRIKIAKNRCSWNFPIFEPSQNLFFVPTFKNFRTILTKHLFCKVNLGYVWA